MTNIRFCVTAWLLGTALLAGCAGGDGEPSPTRAAEPPAIPASPHAGQVVGALRNSFRLPPLTQPTRAPTGHEPAKEVSQPLLIAGAAHDFVRQGTFVVPRFTAPAAGPPAGPAPAVMDLPANANGAFDLRDVASGLSVTVALRGTTDATVEVSDGYLVYPAAYEGTADIVERPYPSGTEQSIAFASAPSAEQIVYDVALGAGVAGVRLVANTVEFLDGQGAPRLRMAPPFIAGAQSTSAWPTVMVGACAVDTSPAPPWNRPVVSPGPRSCTVVVDWSQSPIQYPALLDPSWTVGSTMAVARMHHGSARVTANSKELALVFGGYAFTSTVASSELFDETTGTWAQTGNLIADTSYAPGLTLGSGTALAVGGFRVSASGGAATDDVQAYSPTSGTWTLQGHLGSAREEHTATLLTSGSVLVAGGFGAYPQIFANALLYNPATGTASAAGSMQSARGDHSATLLANGNVLVVDGMGANAAAVSAADLYNPSSNAWSVVPAPPLSARFSQVAPLLPSGNVLIAGGEDLVAGITQTLGTAIYNPTANTWSTGPSTLSSHFLGTGVVLTQGNTAGKVLLAGGDFALTGVELFDPTALTWTPVAPLLTGRDAHVALVLQSGVLFAGGSDSNGTLLSSAELYKPDVAATAPRWPANASLAVAEQGTPTSVTLSWGAATDSNGVANYAVYENGALVATVSGSTLTDTITGLAPGAQDTFAVQAIDPSGAPTWTGPTATYLVVPPSASSMASAIDRTVSTTVATTTSFLYTGTNAIQQGVDAGTIAPATAAVIHGHVYGANGVGLPGVAVTTVNHSEFGSTLTQADGSYDLAVNGGQTLRLHYALASYLPVERLVEAPWQDYLIPNDVVLIHLDAQVTAINVASATQMQVARGTPTTDASGTRQATLLVPPGTQATMTLASGTQTTLSTMSVRATEYSVGASGVNAMPADLPGASAYAYAVELSADEALAAGATKLTFSQPLSLYVEDFLTLPAGTTVPSGYYDPTKGAWVPSGSGIILQIVSVTAGAADIDVTGDGVADTGSALTAIGITTLERQELASLYSVGQLLWRTPVGHFTPFGADPNDGPPADGPDNSSPCLSGAGGGWCGKYGTTGFVCNNNDICGPDDLPVAGCNVSGNRDDCYYFCCPNGAYSGEPLDACINFMCDSPPPPPPPPNGPGNCKNDNASTIECQRQSLGEDIPIAGTSYTLHYESDRQRGRQGELAIPLSATLSGYETGIALRVSVAGRLFTEDFAAQNNENTTFTWDGRDAYGRLLQGAQPVAVDLVYDYAGVYQNAGSFGLQGTGVPIPQSATRQPFTRTKGWRSTVDFWDSQPEGFGGWTLDVHHTYDVTGRVLRFGNGLNRTLADVPPVIQTIAGNGQTGSSGDGTLATSASVTSPESVAIGPDGTVYIADGQSCIRRVGTDGVIHTFAGQCSSPGFAGDGGPATSAKLNSPQDLALGPDGSLYIADMANQRIRRVDAGGVMHTVAGTGAIGFSGDGGQAVLATFHNPTGIDVAPDATLYVADRDNGRIRRIASDGTIATTAGSGASSASTGTGGPATVAGLGTPSKVRVGTGGSFFIAETSGNVVRRVGSEGLIHPVAGTGVAGYGGDGNSAATALLQSPMDLALGVDGSIVIVDRNETVRQVSSRGVITTVAGVAGSTLFGGDNGLATAATMGNANGVRLGPDGSLYIADSADNRVRRVQGALTGFSLSTSSFQFPSEDGRQVYVFDGNGRHLRTVDAFTGATLYSFTYDGSERLATVTDVNGDVTTFAHNGTGGLTGVVGPFGQQTTFTPDTNGYLASATDPASELTRFTYDANGMMLAKLDARGGLSEYTYDSVGRLIEDQDAAGGSKMLTLSSSAMGFTVTSTTSLGRQTTYQTTPSTTGGLARTNGLPSGIQTSLQQGLISTTVVQADKTQLTTTETPDPRPGFGMLAPQQSVTTTTVSGLSSTTATTRAATFSGNALATFTEQTSLNGNAWTKLFNAATRTWTMTSPAGRQSSMVVDTAGRPTQTSLPNVAPFTFAYDAHGHLKTMTQGTHTWTSAYDPNGYLAAATDPLSHTTSFANDAIGRPTTTTLPDARVLGTTYDPNGNVTKVVLPSAAAHAFTFTPVDLTASYTPPNLTPSVPPTTYAYDLDRELTTVTRPDGVTIANGYDSAGRLASRTIPQGSYTFAYDDVSGYLSQSTTPGGEILSYTYDGFLKTGVTWNGPVPGSLSFGFDNNFRMTSQTVGGTALGFSYDLDGLLTGAGALTLVPDTQNGRLTGTTLGAMTDSYTYDANGLFASYTAKYGGSPLYAESVVRDAAGRITQKTETLQGTTLVWGYTFDAAGRLTDVTKGGAFFSHYGYDADDNRTTYQNASGTTHPTYDAQDRLLTYGPATYGYTANGELTSKTVAGQTTNFTYDPLGNLLHVGPPAASAIDYVVDGENRRVGKEVAGTMSEGFLYQDALNVVAHLDAGGNVLARYVFATKPNVPDYFTTSSGTFRIVSDHLGSPRLIVDVSSGSIIEEIDYDEFGVVTNDTNRGLTPFGFAGGLYDKDTGLVRFGARDYDASAGRWTSKDPVRFNGRQINLYVYAASDPVNWRDSSGTDSCSLTIGTVGVSVCAACGVAPGFAGIACGGICGFAFVIFGEVVCVAPPPPPRPTPAPMCCDPSVASCP